jgi:hypothetical protein
MLYGAISGRSIKTPGNKSFSSEIHAYIVMILFWTNQFGDLYWGNERGREREREKRDRDRQIFGRLQVPCAHTSVASPQRHYLPAGMLSSLWPRRYRCVGHNIMAKDFFLIWLHWARASSFSRYLDHTQRRITVGRTPMDEWSARRRDLYLTTHNTHNRQTSMPPAEFEPRIAAGVSNADPRIRPRGQWDRPRVVYQSQIYKCRLFVSR